MAYAVLTAEITGRWTNLRNTLDDVDNRLAQVAAKRYEVKVDVDRTILNQIREIRSQLENIPAAELDMTLRLNGVDVTIDQIKQIGENNAAVTQAVAEDWETAERKAREAIELTYEAEEKARAARMASDRAAGAAMGEYEPVDMAAMAEQAKRFAAAERELNQQAKEATQALNAQADAEMRSNLALARRMEAQGLKSDGAIASVIGGEKNIGVAEYNAALKEEAANLAVVDKNLRTASAATEQFNKVMLQSQAMIDGAAAAGDKLGNSIGNRLAKDTATAKKEMDELNGAVNRGMSMWEKARLTIVAFLSSYLLISGIISGFRALEYAVVGFNSMLEQSRIAFTTLLRGTGQSVDVLMHQLITLARLTPFEFKDLVPLTQRLVALGVVAREHVNAEAIPALRAIGNAAAGLGAGTEGVQRITLALGQMATKGKAQAEEITRQLGEIGIQAPKYLAEAFGITVGQVFEQMKKGAIEGHKAVKAILEGMQRDYAGMMEKMAGTWEGASNNIKDAATIVISTSFQPMFEWLSKIAQRVAEIAGTKAFANWAQGEIRALIRDLEDLGSIVVWLAVTVNDKLPYIIGYFLAIGSHNVLTAIRAAEQSILTLGMTTATSAQIAAAKMNLWIMAVMLFIAAYRNITIVRDISENVGLAVIRIFEGVVWTITKVIGELSALYNKFAIIGSGLTGFNLPKSPFEGLEKDTAKTFNEMGLNFLAGKDKADKFVVGGIGGATDFKKMMEDARKEIQATVQEAEKAGSITKQSLGAGDGKKEAAKAAAAAKRLREDELRDSAQFNEKMARLAEETAQRQIKALQSVADKMRELFGGAQEELLKLGVVTNPLQPLIDKFQKMAGLGDMATAISTQATDLAKGYRSQGLSAREELNKLSGGNGAVPGYEVDMNKGALRDSIGQWGNKTLLNIADSFAQGAPYLSCAHVASALVNQMGYHITSSDSAGKLRATAKRFWERVTGPVEAGDLVFKGGGGPSGWHAQAGVGPGMVLNSNHRQQRIYGYSGGEVFRAPGGAGGGMSFGGLPADFEREYGKAGQAIDHFNESFAKIAALPASWGAPIRDTTNHTILFKLQTELANAELQKMLHLIYGARFDSFIAQLRAAANQAQAMVNRLKEMNAAQDELAKMRKARQVEDAKGNPLALLELEFAPGGKYASIPGAGKDTMRAETQRDMSRSVRDWAHEYMEQSRQAVYQLQVQDKWMRNNAFSEREMNRALEESATRMKLFNDANKDGVVTLEERDYVLRMVSQHMTEYDKGVANKDTIERWKTFTNQVTLAANATQGLGAMFGAIFTGAKAQLQQEMMDRWANTSKFLDISGALSGFNNILGGQQDREKSRIAVVQAQADYTLKQLEAQRELSQLERQELDWSLADKIARIQGHEVTLEEKKSREEIRKILRDSAAFDLMTKQQQQTQEAIKQGWQQMSEVIGHSLDTVVTSSGSFFQRMRSGVGSFIGGVADDLEKLAERIATNYLLSQLMGVSGVSDILGSINQAANRTPQPDFGGNFGYDPGMSVPGYQGGLGTDSLFGHPSANSVVINHYGDVRANDPQEYAAKMKEKAPKQASYDSRRTTAKNVAAVADYGRRGAAPTQGGLAF